jgi:tight adherence protein B
MTRACRNASLLAAVVALVLSAAGGASAASEITISEAGSARFPDRAYVLSLPTGAYLDESRAEVRENGELVSEFAIVPANAAEAERLASVLVIDASMSMRGRAIEDAVAAARAFVGSRNPGQELAIVAFNNQPRILLPFTAEEDQIQAALAEAPVLASGTHIYDAVQSAIGLLEEAGVTAGSVIVLSDGADTGSTASLADVVRDASAGHVRVFTVGLRSPPFAPEPLRALAAQAGGEYSEANSSDDLTPIFDALGRRLANEYVLRYRSEARADTDVQVSVVIDGFEGLATIGYHTPARLEPGPPFHRSPMERFFRSQAGMISTALFAALFVALAVAAIARPQARTLRRRMAEFVTLAARSGEDDARGQRQLMLARAEKPFERTRLWARFKEELELADIQTPSSYILAGTLLGTLFAVWVLYVIGGLLVAWIGLSVPLVVRATIRRKLERKRRKFADQLPDNLQVLSSALRAGHSLVGALSVVVEDCPEPSRAEFRRVIADEQLGIPLEDAFYVVATRMDSRELEQVALVAALQRETGGNTAEVLDRVAETIRGRFELKRLVRTLTAQGRMSRWVVSLLPVGLLLLITSISPAYMRPLYVNPVGRVLLVVAAVMIVAGSLVIRRIVDIKV